MGKKKILIIDDEPGFTHLLKLNLEKTGSYEVKEENNGTCGLASARAFKPDLVLLDVVMSEVDGGTVAAQIKADEGIRQTPILFLTAVLSKQESQRFGSAINGHPCIAKPVSTEEVIEQIEKYLRNNPRKGDLP